MIRSQQLISTLLAAAMLSLASPVFAQGVADPGRLFGDNAAPLIPRFVGGSADGVLPPRPVAEAASFRTDAGSVGHVYDEHPFVFEPTTPGVPPAPGGSGVTDGRIGNPSYGDTGRPVDTSHLFADPVMYNDALPKAEEPLGWKVFEFGPEVVEFPHKPLSRLFAFLVRGKPVDPHTELDERPIGIQPIPERPPLIIETDEPFLAPGWLQQGIEMPTGAIWRPALWVFGTYRNGINYFDNPRGTNTRLAEWAHRLDLFAQVNFTGTERLLLGLRPLDQEVGRTRQFNSYDFRGGDWINGWNGDIQTLFFEGDFGEIFPRLDPLDSEQLDIGFSVGRMPLFAQQGLFINEDKVDALTITRNTLYGPGLLNLRMTGVYAWDEINRNNNAPDPDAHMYALLTESDFKFSTVNADVAYVQSPMQNGDLIAWAVSGIQRLHGFNNTYNSSVHFLSSHALNGESPVAGNGQLLFSQFSWTPHHSVDLLYVNAFWAIDQFTAPARGTLAGGPLGQTGLLFSAPGLGRFPAPLSNQASNTAGASIGYQMFFDDTRKQVIFEIGGRADTHKTGLGDMGAVGARYQQALGQHWIFILDGVVTKTEGSGFAAGTRVEFLAKF
jgi:hypothetical protein